MTKAELREYRELAKEVRQLSDQIMELRTEMDYPRIAQLDGMPKTQTRGDRMERLMIRLEKMEQKYERKRLDLLTIMDTIEDAIEILPSRERQLIRHYYIGGLTWEEVCVQMHLSWRHIHRIHDSALRALNGTK